MAASSSKRAASSPLSSESDKKPRLGLADGEISVLNNSISSFMKLIPGYDKLSGADVTSLFLAVMLQQIALRVFNSSRASSLDKRWLDLRECDKRINELPYDELQDLKSAWVEARNTGWGNLVSHVLLQVSPPNREDQEATEKSWEQPFQGDAAEGLWNHIETYFTSTHAHYATVVQSSGMGKSRTVDELGKVHFTLSSVLREAHSTGYPPADDIVRDYLTEVSSKHEAYDHASAFLEALFIHTAEVVSKFDQSLDYYGLAREFRTRMTEGQKMTRHNGFREEFYYQVVAMAKNFTHIRSQEYPPCVALKKLIKSLRFPEGKGKQQKAIPLVVLAFDEAHTTTERHLRSTEKWSVFNEICEALQRLQSFPLFSLFLSTTGKMSQFTSVMRQDNSARIMESRLIVIEPYTDIGFDPLAIVISLDGAWNLEKLTDIAQMSSQGRPLIATRYQQGSDSVKREIILFAAAKLLNDDHSIEELSNEQALACLSQRFPIEFNSTNYISQETERKQVEGHMRVCLKIDAAFETMTTTSSSEPTLSEAAYFVMQKPSFNAPDALKSVMEGFPISKGDHGEFLVLLLLILARDATVGPADEFGQPVSKKRWFSLSEFLYGQLYQEQTEPTSFMDKNSILAMKTLQKDFPNAQLHFNHFVKVHEHRAIDLTSLLLLKGWGAAVLCPNNQTGIDAINIFLKDGTQLIRSNAGLILHQMNDDANYTKTRPQNLFDLMDPYERGILSDDCPAVPVIKIVFALAARKPSLHVVRNAPTTSYDAVVYEIWCAGISPDIFRPIKSGIWDSLLQASCGWQESYRSPSTVISNLRQSAVPGTALDPGHYSRWARWD